MSSTNTTNSSNPVEAPVPTDDTIAEAEGLTDDDAVLDDENSASNNNNNTNTDTASASDDTKEFKICDVLGGLDATRLVSTNARNFFSSAIDDVELMREYLSEAWLSPENDNGSGNWISDFPNLDQMSRTLDWQARGLPIGTTSVEAGIGYADDRPDRRVDKFCGLLHEPFVGDKESDFAMVDAISPLMPWIVDRKSKESNWWNDHINGVSQSEEKEPFLFDALYTAAWLVSWAEVVIYYPPLAVYGHPLTMGDVVGGTYDSHGDAFIVPNLPENNPQRTATFTSPYPDTALEGVALITATAPVYYTGTFRNNTYKDTFIASLGVDIQVSSVSAFLDVLQDSLTPHSFGLMVDSNFNTIVISQEVVRRIYPARTGMEEERVQYDLVDGSIVQDRRNQTYLPSDTILENLTQLDNADWAGLRNKVQEVTPGQRDFAMLNVTITGQTKPDEYFVMFEQWEYVADWVLLVFAPKAEVENAINVYYTVDTTTAAIDDSDNGPSVSKVVTMEGTQGDVLEGRSTLVNGGGLDVKFSLSDIPNWVTLDEDILALAEEDGDEAFVTLRAGESLPVNFQVATEDLAPGTQSDSIVFEVQDADYPDCFFREPLSIPFSVRVNAQDCGDHRVANADGTCVCDTAAVAIGNGCTSYAVLVTSIVLPLVALILVAIYFCAVQKRRKDDAIWEIDPEELEFSNPPESLGKGSFGQVVLANYRGTKVAVKTIRPSDQKQKGAHESVACVQDAMEKGTPQLSTKGEQPPATARSTDENRNRGGRWSRVLGGMRSSLTEKEKNQRAAFIDEMRLLSKLRHPNITMYMGGVVKDGSSPMLVLEYMERGSLYDLLKSDATLDGDLIRSILQDIMQGVRYLHSNNPQIIHGDLKSQNILIDNKLKAKVADFGLLQSTPYWMSPELLLEMSNKTMASDVFALGITFYEIYARDTPYTGENTFKVLQAVIDPNTNKRPPIPSAMPSCVAAMMHDCVLAIPEDRPSLNELQNRINRFKPEDVAMINEGTVDKNTSYNVGFLNKLFPSHVADDLANGRPVKPETHDCVTVLCCDILNFASLSSELSPIKIADLLHRLFDRFDTLSETYDIFKVDMMGGGAWLGATNCVKDQTNDHTKRISQFAVEIERVARETPLDKEHPERGFVQLQIAFHSGPVVAKVIGTVTPRYSLLGETIETVTQLAKKAEPGVILCSEASENLIEEQAPEIPTKSKGQIFLEGNREIAVFWVNQQEGAEQPL